MHNVVRGKWACGIKTASTANPSASRTSSFVVPSAASSLCSSRAGTNFDSPLASKTRRAPIVVGASASNGSWPLRTASQIDLARPLPPTSSLSSAKGSASVGVEAVASFGGVSVAVLRAFMLWSSNARAKARMVACLASAAKWQQRCIGLCARFPVLPLPQQKQHSARVSAWRSGAYRRRSGPALRTALKLGISAR